MVRIRMTIPRGETQERRHLRRRGEHHRRGEHRREYNRRGRHQRGGVEVCRLLVSCAGGVPTELLVGGVDVVRGLSVEVQRVEVERVEVQRVEVEVMCRCLVPCAGGVATEAVLVRGVPVLP